MVGPAGINDETHETHDEKGNGNVDNGRAGDGKQWNPRNQQYFDQSGEAQSKRDEMRVNEREGEARLKF